ncbi:hypothetical protein RRF57_003662 [Xylaria bambusicola]|uniref:Uncharacterized protein n=1 Tax=Xylaria bambusicola TaxID=326684 RepID=A0AAN7Z314_9PEZI
MDNLSLDTADLDKLNDKDKTELRQFLQNENQKARVQASTSASTYTHTSHIHIQGLINPLPSLA